MLLVVQVEIRMPSMMIRGDGTMMTPDPFVSLPGGLPERPKVGKEILQGRERFPNTRFP
jgi:hypothetical protein